MKRKWLILPLVLLGLVIINPPERYNEYKDSIRKSDIDRLKENTELYIKYNSGGRINLGLVGTLYDSSSELTDSDGQGWLPIRYRSSGVGLKKLPLDPVNKDTLVYTFSTSSRLLYKLTARFESSKFKKLAASDSGVRDDLYEVGTDLSLKPGRDL